jgi:hypothetical protein
LSMIYLKEVRAFMYKCVLPCETLKNLTDAIVSRIMRLMLSPDNIYAHRHEEQDVILWYARALWHSIVSLPQQYDFFSLVLIV